MPRILDNPRYCTRCGFGYSRDQGHCPKCRCQEFSLAPLPQTAAKAWKQRKEKPDLSVVVNTHLLPKAGSEAMTLESLYQDLEKARHLLFEANLLIEVITFRLLREGVSTSMIRLKDDVPF